MNSKKFDHIVSTRLQLTESVLLSKAKEYANDEDRLHNFVKAGKMSNQTPEKALRGMLLKHVVSLDDIIENIDKGILPSEALLEEKIGDIINYHILIEACILERIYNSKPRDIVNEG